MLAKSAAYTKWSRALTAFTVAVDQHLAAEETQRAVEFSAEPCIENTRKFLVHFGLSPAAAVEQNLHKLAELIHKGALKDSERDRVREMRTEWQAFRNLLSLCNYTRLQRAEEILGRRGLFQDRVAILTLDNMFDRKSDSSLWFHVDPYSQGISRFTPRHFALARHVVAKRKAVSPDAVTTTPRAELKEWLRRLAEVQRRAGVDVALAMTAFLVQELHRVTDGLQSTARGIPSAQQLGKTLLKQLPVSVDAATPDSQLPVVVPDVASWMSRVAQSYINFQIATGMATFVADFKSFDGRCRPVLSVLKYVFPDVATSIVNALDSIGNHVHGDSLVSTLDAFKTSGHHKQELEAALAARTKGIDTWAAQIADRCEPSQFPVQYERLAGMELKFLTVSYPKMLEGNLIERGFQRQLKLYTQLLELVKTLHEQNPSSSMKNVRGEGEPVTAWQQRYAMDWKKPVGEMPEVKLMTDQLGQLRASAQTCNEKLRKRGWPESPLVNECMSVVATPTSKETPLARVWEWARCATYTQSWFAYATIWLGGGGEEGAA